MYKSWWIHEVFLCSQGIPRSKVAVTHTQWKSMEIARWPNRNPRSHRPRWPRESRSSLPEHHTCSNGSETAEGSAILVALSRGKMKGKWRENEGKMNMVLIVMSNEHWGCTLFSNINSRNGKPSNIRILATKAGCTFNPEGNWNCVTCQILLLWDSSQQTKATAITHYNNIIINKHHKERQTTNHQLINTKERHKTHGTDWKI